MRALILVCLLGTQIYAFADDAAKTPNKRTPTATNAEARKASPPTVVPPTDSDAASPEHQWHFLGTGNHHLNR